MDYETTEADFLGLSTEAKRLYANGMSEEDLGRARQKALDDYEACKKHFADLEAAAKQTVRYLEKVCEFLRGGYNRFSPGELEEILSPKTIGLMAELHQTSERVKILRETARQTHPYLDL
jgi:hypothetical protein